MEESLSSARSVHLVLVGVCAAIALFAASPRELDKYFKAGLELDALRAVELGDLAEYEKALTIADKDKIPWLQPKNLFPEGRIIASLSPIDLFPVVWDDWAVGHSPDDSTIDEWFKAFETKHPIKMFVPDEHDSAFQEFITKLREFAKSNSAAELQSFSFKNGVDDITSPTSLPAYAVYSTKGSGAAPVAEADVRARELIVSTDALRPWFASAESTARLRRLTSFGGPWLENLQTVRNEISGMKLPEVARYFAGRIVSTNRKINVFGATIDEPLAVVGGPIAVLLPLVYLLLLTWHIGKFPARAFATTQNYPWIILFPGWQGGAVTLVSIVLPMAVCIWLFLTSYRSASLTASAISAGVIMLVFGAAVAALLQFGKLRSRIERTAGR